MKLVVRVLLLTLLAGIAGADEGSKAYITIRPISQGFSGEVTVLEQTRESERSYAVGGALGVSFNDYLMMDMLSINYHNSDYRGNDASSLNIITEVKAGYFGGDFPLKPYVAVGLGASRVKFDFLDPSMPGLSDWGLAWEAGAGLEYPIENLNMSLGLFYRYRSSVSLASSWNPVPINLSMTEEQQALYNSGWEINYHAIGLELRFGGVR